MRSRDMIRGRLVGALVVRRASRRWWTGVWVGFLGSRWEAYAGTGGRVSGKVSGMGVYHSIVLACSDSEEDSERVLCLLIFDD